MADNAKPVLKITKYDGSVHFAPVGTERLLNHQNTLNHHDKKSKIERVEMTDQEIEDHPAFDPTHVPVKGTNETAKLKKLADSQEKQIADLQEQLKNAGSKIEVPAGLKAAQVIALIQEATTVEMVDELIEDDTRLTVTSAAEKRKEELKA